MNTLDFKKQPFVDYIISYKQTFSIEDIHLHADLQGLLQPLRYIASNSQQTAGWYHGCLVSILDQCVGYLLRMFVVIINFQVWKLWLPVDSGMLGLMQD